ncbi:ribosome-recycling factor, mitochondrial [Hyalella azteca]|uniref:Ribosome-recycling factor, mitochondrial n=1 Tax=Hyalella azteca TaxID=294128 RepID=A0A8B7N775_HYAAZ|nr:ribosome-recycling factor, mitochondrial [Hyalella azteca]
MAASFILNLSSKFQLPSQHLGLVRRNCLSINYYRYEIAPYKSLRTHSVDCSLLNSCSEKRAELKSHLLRHVRPMFLGTSIFLPLSVPGLVSKENTGTAWHAPPLMQCLSLRWMSKSKGGGKGKGKSVIHLTAEEMSSVVNEKQLLQEMDSLVEDFRQQLISAVAVRTNVGSLEALPVELEGDTFPLSEIAQVHRKGPHLVVLDCSAFPQATKGVVDVILASGMNLSPQQEGTRIAVPLPKVTREHREGLLQKAKVLGQRCKDELRQQHNACVRKVKSKEGQVSSDLIFKVTLKVKELLDERIRTVDELLAAKQTELLKP